MLFTDTCLVKPHKIHSQSSALILTRMSTRNIAKKLKNFLIVAVLFVLSHWWWFARVFGKKAQQTHVKWKVLNLISFTLNFLSAPFLHLAKKNSDFLQDERVLRARDTHWLGRRELEKTCVLLARRFCEETKSNNSLFISFFTSTPLHRINFFCISFLSSVYIFLHVWWFFLFCCCLPSDVSLSSFTLFFSTTAASSSAISQYAATETTRAVLSDSFYSVHICLCSLCFGREYFKLKTESSQSHQHILKECRENPQIT